MWGPSLGCLTLLHLEGWKRKALQSCFWLQGVKPQRAAPFPPPGQGAYCRRDPLQTSPFSLGGWKRG